MMEPGQWWAKPDWDDLDNRQLLMTVEYSDRKQPEYTRL